MFVCKLLDVYKSKCKVHIWAEKETFIMTRGGLIALLFHGRYSCKYGGQDRVYIDQDQTWHVNLY